VKCVSVPDAATVVFGQARVLAVAAASLISPLQYRQPELGGFSLSQFVTLPTDKDFKVRFDPSKLQSTEMPSAIPPAIEER